MLKEWRLRNSCMRSEVPVLSATPKAEGKIREIRVLLSNCRGRNDSCRREEFRFVLNVQTTPS